METRRLHRSRGYISANDQRVQVDQGTASDSMCELRFSTCQSRAEMQVRAYADVGAQ
jgi:hypothetical protein